MHAPKLEIMCNLMLDVKANSLAVSVTQGKLTKLEEKDPELLEAINKEW